jgi:cell division protein FtsQ
MRRLLAYATGRSLGAGTARAPLGTAALRARARRLLLRPRLLVGVLIAGLLLGLGWLWLRDSSLVAVKRVTIAGLTGPDAGRIRVALTAAARNQTTLHVRMDALRSAAAPFPIVKDLRVVAHPPHSLRIDVVEQIPVATVRIAGRAVPVAPDGTLLHDTAGIRHLPALPFVVAPGAIRLSSPSERRAVDLLAAAPAALRARVTRLALSRAHGLVGLLRRGPAIYFGDSSRAAAKWQAAAAVLGDSHSAGARYVDVRVPERPAAGGLPPAPAATPAATAATPSNIVPPAAAGGSGAGTGGPATTPNQVPTTPSAPTP